jgi:hypothetical protein
MAEQLYYILAAKKGTTDFKPVLPENRAPRMRREAPNIKNLFQCTEIEARKNKEYLKEKGYDVKITSVEDTVVVDQMKLNDRTRDDYNAAAIKDRLYMLNWGELY